MSSAPTREEIAWQTRDSGTRLEGIRRLSRMRLVRRLVVARVVTILVGAALLAGLSAYYASRFIDDGQNAKVP